MCISTPRDSDLNLKGGKFGFKINKAGKTFQLGSGWMHSYERLCPRMSSARGAVDTTPRDMPVSVPRHALAGAEGLEKARALIELGADVNARPPTP